MEDLKVVVEWIAYCVAVEDIKNEIPEFPIELLTELIED
tara:strand:+ start:2838 stop:2954 length:117 start_codon:yes stop_codon:yes gene_type:complete